MSGISGWGWKSPRLTESAAAEKEAMKLILDKKVYFVGGKGGVGKSTCSAALALLLSEKGKKVLLVSTDPAHNTGDLFHLKPGQGIMNVSRNLDILEINSESEAKRYIEEVKGNLKGLVKASMADEVYRQIDLAASSPGADEAAVFDRITSLLLDEMAAYDTIVFDTAPTGHTIRLLTLPELMSAWIDGLLQRRKKNNDNFAQWMNDGEPVEDPIYEKLLSRKNKFAKVREILLDSQSAACLFVLNAERLPILETEKAVRVLAGHGLHTEAVIVNKVIPEEADGRFMKMRRENENQHLNEIRKVFSAMKNIHIPLFHHDISEPAHLGVFARHLSSELVKSIE